MGYAAYTATIANRNKGATQGDRYINSSKARSTMLFSVDNNDGNHHEAITLGYIFDLPDECLALVFQSLSSQIGIGAPLWAGSGSRLKARAATILMVNANETEDGGERQTDRQIETRWDNMVVVVRCKVWPLSCPWWLRSRGEKMRGRETVVGVNKERRIRD